MDFTKEQLSELICKHTEKENGLQDLMEIMFESLMVSERREYLQEEGIAGNKCNGYRPGRTYGHGRTLTFRIPRDRYGNFHPRILAILRDQEEECERLAGTLYTKGLTQEQVGEVFNDIYGEHYSKASISIYFCKLFIGQHIYKNRKETYSCFPPTPIVCWLKIILQSYRTLSIHCQLLDCRACQQLLLTSDQDRTYSIQCPLVPRDLSSKYYT